MVAAFFTKPLQGSQFRRLRRLVLGMDPMSFLDLLPLDAHAFQGRDGKVVISESHDLPVTKAERKLGRSYADVFIGI